ncbi:MAG: aryl-sulfate sulfotransferase [Halioglobus sp.]
MFQTHSNFADDTVSFSKRLASALLVSFIVLASACGGGGSSGSGGDSDAGSESPNENVIDVVPTDIDFRVSAHSSNVLMVEVRVKTDEEAQVSIEFESSETERRRTSTSAASTTHEFTVFGLRPETNYQFTALVTDQSGETISSDLQTFTTSSLPFELPDLELKSSNERRYPGVTFFAVSGENARFMAVDEAGVPVWYLDDTDVPMLSNSPVIKHLGENRLMLMLNREVRVIDMVGNLLSVYELPTYHHEATILKNGNIVVLTNEYGEFGGNTLQGDRIEEYNPSGELVWLWSSFEHLDTFRFPGELSTRLSRDGAYEWTHSNAIFEQEDGSLLLSVRSQSWVVNIDHMTGDINWILGSSEGTSRESLHDKFISLQSGSLISAQHAPLQMANGDYLIYDNRNEAELRGTDNNSRGVAYQLDSLKMTATQVWEFVVDKYTKSLGDIDELPNGNILITAGGPGSNENAHLVEVTAEEPAQVVWELHVNNESIYRAERVGWETFLTLSSQPLGELTVGGTITGLHADGLELTNAGATLSIAAGATLFELTQTAIEGSEYNVQLATTPIDHTCIIENSSGTVLTDVDDITINCVDRNINADLTSLPIGDPSILQRNMGDGVPEVGKLWLCRLPEDGAGAAASDDWTNEDGSWNYITKPQVQGQNYLMSEFNVMLDGQGKRLITGNNLPTTPTGTFPIERGSIAWDYDKNPNSISSHNVRIEFDEIPTLNPEPSCVGFGANGISLTGAAIYQGSSTVGTDAAAYEMLDSSGGHTDGTQTYHYHYLSQAVLDELNTGSGGHSALMGYMQDGFGIFGPLGEDGKILASADLDECHGHTHEIEWDNEIRNMFHYHWTYDFPYNVGCFRGTPQALGINSN